MRELFARSCLLFSCERRQAGGKGGQRGDEEANMMTAASGIVQMKVPPTLSFDVMFSRQFPGGGEHEEGSLRTR